MSVPANGAQVPPSSPQRSTPATIPDVNKLQSTPSNRGLSAAGNLGIHDVIIDNLSPRVKEDLRKAHHCGGTVWGEEQRMNKAAILDVVKDTAADLNNDVKGHVPIVLLSHKFDVSTSNIRVALGIEPEDARKGSRTLYLLVSRKLRPIWELQPQPEELHEAWCQTILCHYGLWKGNVHHRDISASNLMYRRADGVLVGVLNDFDLATLAGSGHRFGNERTGTVPFMAIDLLTKRGQNGHVEHQYRHDTESFIWVFTWISCQYKDGKFRSGYFAELAELDASRCAMEKTWLLHYVESKIPSDLEPTVRFRVLCYKDHLSRQLHSRRSINLELELLRIRANGNLLATDPKAQILELEEGLKEKGVTVDEVFRVFAALIES